MITISKATAASAPILSQMGRQTFLEAHSTSSPAEDLAEYVSTKYALPTVQAEIANPKNIIHLIHYQSQPAGFSKIEFDSPFHLVKEANACKLDRLYLLKEFYGLKLGLELLEFNYELAKKAGQSGFWLYVWMGNDRAIRFYKKTGFEIIGEADFRLSARRVNPNHIMWKAIR